jgi:hypothetical protein
VQRPPLGAKIIGRFLTSARCSDLGLCYKDLNWNSKISGRCRQVVVNSGLTAVAKIRLKATRDNYIRPGDLFALKTKIKL